MGGLLVIFLIGILEVGRYMVTLVGVRTVAADAIRLAVLRGSANLNRGAAACQNLSGSLKNVVNAGPMLDAADLSVALSGCMTQSGMTSVTVTVTYPFIPSIPMLTLAAQELREQGTAIIF